MDIYQHFREEERPFIDQVLSWCVDVEMKYQRKLSDFLNPREQMIVQMVIGNHPDLTYGFAGGHSETERKRVIIAPDYEVIDEKDYQLILLEATYPVKFITLEHRDVLGAFMSLGIRREKLGDLIVKEGKIHIVTASEISDYIQMNLTGVKKANVQFKETPIHQLMKNDETWEIKDMTVSSLRLDVLTKEIYGMSRKKAAMHIDGGDVKVNFRLVEDTSFQLVEKDMISLRGKGRSRIDVVHGKTKKEKFRISASKLN